LCQIHAAPGCAGSAQSIARNLGLDS
jgi:hypothetical protein